jgi:type I restriction enzyme S subunit
MNAELLLALYERIADAPDAIARLRRFVLDLAVRGKLVEQDPKDEPASELLKLIAAERVRLVAAGLVRKPKPIPKLEALPYDLPANWAWSQIAEIGVLNPRVEAEDAVMASFVPMPLIAAEYGVPNDHEARPWGQIKKGYTHFAEGDVGLAKITPCFENGKSTVFRNLTGGIGSGTTELHVVRPVLVNPDYILLFWKCPFFIENGIPRMTGTAGQKRVPTDYFANSVFPLPPLAEQHRIVAKVDELMALCDQLETAQAEREKQRKMLTLSTLAKLNEPDPETFPDDARFALQHLKPLTKRTDQIKQLRQTILNLAVRGKLVQQDTNDEPALTSLSRLSDVPPKTKKLQKPLDGPEHELPSGWTWVPLGGLIHGMDAGWSPQCENHPRVELSQWGVLKTTAVQTLAFDSAQHKQLPSKLAPRPQFEAKVGDILVTRAGPKNRVGVSCVVDVDCPRLMISDKLIRFHGLGDLSPRYLALTLNAGVTLRQIEDAKSGMAVMQMNISQDKLKAVHIPLPPIPEQYRIVSKVDELMALCDQLEASIAEGEQTRSMLLEAVLHEALDPIKIN